MVEDMFRTMKSILETRPIYHKRDETIRGFPALLLRRAMEQRLEQKGESWERAEIVRGLYERSDSRTSGAQSEISFFCSCRRERAPFSSVISGKKFERTHVRCHGEEVLQWTTNPPTMVSAGAALMAILVLRRVGRVRS